jgi:hypothetical protein
MAKKKEASPATPAPATESTVEAYDKVKSTPEWKGLFSLLIIFLANCIKWNCLKKATDFLGKVVEGMNKSFVPAPELIDPFPTESVFLPEWPIYPYDDKAKQYFKPGTTERVKSVTTINKNCGWASNALMFWARKMMFEGRDPIERRDSAADVGKVTHYLAECWLKKSRPEVNRIPPDVLIQAKLGFAEFLKWEKESGVVWIASELSLVGEVGKNNYPVGGTADAVGIINEKLILMDFKTGSGIYSEAVIQVAAYRHLIQSGPYYNLDDAMILHFPQGKATLVQVNIERSALDCGFEVFKHLCELEKLNETMKKEMLPIYSLLGQKVY